MPTRKLPRHVDTSKLDFSGRILPEGEPDEEIEVQRIADRGKEGEAGVPVAQILRKHGISRATFIKRERIPFLIDPRPNAVWAIDYMHDAL